MTHEDDPPLFEYSPGFQKRTEERQRRADEKQAAYEAEVAEAREVIRQQREACDTGDFEALQHFLMEQSHALNILFNQRLEDAAGPRLDNERLSHILRTQRECRQTVLTLNRLRGAEGQLRAAAAREKEISSKQTDRLDRHYNSGGHHTFDFSKDTNQ